MKPKTMTVYLGWDPREEVAYEVARFSIARRTNEPIKIIPLKLKHLDMLKRPIEMRDGQMWCPISNAPMSTEFAISRFCVPFLQDEGWAVFADCDILCWSDIRELFDLADEQYAVQVVKHKHEWTAGTPETSLKMDNQIQTFYSRKNWSSVVLWNCDHPANKKFTIQNLNEWPGRDLHAFKWLQDSEIGELPQHWNWLIKVTKGEPEQKGIWHYTLGGPWFEDYFDDYAQEWCDEAERLKHGLGVPVLS
jgi:lipopolysaccharide biosynthesis glycosyltransferase